MTGRGTTRKVDGASGVSHCSRSSAFRRCGPDRVARPRAVQVEEGATCFFHEQNAAESVCRHCGRYLCPVCQLDFGHGPECAACLEAERKQAPSAVTQRITYDRLALLVAGLPVFMWPLTLVTAPTALFLVVFGWRQPGSLLGKSRLRLGAAALIAVAQLVGWGFLIANLWIRA
jgi:hypothetical protein